MAELAIIGIVAVFVLAIWYAQRGGGWTDDVGPVPPRVDSSGGTGGGGGGDGGAGG
jgi:hypothetical protein